MAYEPNPVKPEPKKVNAKHGLDLIGGRESRDLRFAFHERDPKQHGVFRHVGGEHPHLQVAQRVDPARREHEKQRVRSGSCGAVAY